MNRLRSWSNSSLDDLPADIHKIIEICDAIEKKFEETQNPVLLREDSMSMDVDINPVSIQSQFFFVKDYKKTNLSILFYSIDSTSPQTETQNNNCTICLDDLDATQVVLPVCQHRFHRDCIEKWFQSSGKQSCPTCGHIYGIMKGMNYQFKYIYC